jgi:quinolinate synthase
VRILPAHIAELKRQYPDAEVMVHPECLSEVVAMADVVASTGGMLRHAQQSAARTIIVGTEVGLLHRLKIENPDKQFIPVTPMAVCPNMKRITPEKVLWSMEEQRHQVTVPAEVAGPARRAIERMLALGGRPVSIGLSARSHPST